VNMNYSLFVTVWLLLYRLVLGGTFMLHGYPKLKDRAKQAGQWMNNMGIPAWTAVLATILEFFGGITLIFGLLTQIVAIFFAIFMVSNIIMKRMKMKSPYISTEKPSYEMDVLYLLLSVTLVLLGPGAISIDHLIGFFGVI